MILTNSLAPARAVSDVDGLDDSIDDSVDEGEDDVDEEGDEEGDEMEEEDTAVGGDEDDEDELDEEEEEEDDFASDAQLDDEDEEQPLSEDDDDEDDDEDANFKINDDDDLDVPEEELEAPAPPKKRSLNLKIKLPVSKKEETPANDELDGYDDYDDDDDDEDNLEIKKPRKTRKITETKISTPSTNPISRRQVGRPRKTAAAKVNYNEDEEFDDLVSDSENVIPTPALDDDLLLTDEETEYTPDVTKMTERQRAKLENEEAGAQVQEQQHQQQLLSLSNDVHKRRVLTEEENQLRKAEIARKRKNLTERNLEEEKQETINKLLKRRAGKVSAATLKEDEEVNLKEKPRRPQIEHPALFSWVSKKDTLALRVPEPLIE